MYVDCIFQNDVSILFEIGLRLKLGNSLCLHESFSVCLRVYVIVVGQRNYRVQKAQCCRLRDSEKISFILNNKFFPQRFHLFNFTRIFFRILRFIGLFVTRWWETCLWIFLWV